MSRRRWLALPACLLVAPLLATEPARAGGRSPAQCADAYASAQLLRKRGKLSDARDAARACADSSCPAVARADCTAWASELDRAIPSVVVAAQGAGAGDRPPRVFVDGVRRDDAASARAIELDPGDHRFRVERDGALPVEQTVTIFQGERDRILRFELRPAHEPARAAAPAPASAAAPETTSTTYVPAIAVGAIGVVALGASAWLGVTGRSDLSSLRSTCAPACTDEQLDPVRRKLVVSDIALGVGVIAAAVSVYLFARPPSGAAAPKSSARLELRGTWLGIDASF